MKKEDYLENLAKGVLEYDEELVESLSYDYLKEGYPAIEAVMHGLVKGMEQAGKLFSEDEYFVTDLLLCSDAMYVGINILSPHISKSEQAEKIVGVIGVIEGDTHDIGKNLVKTMFEAAGFEMIDLGRNVPATTFIDVAKEHQAQLICISTLMTTTMKGMQQVIDLLNKEGIRDQFKVLIGGGTISPKFCQNIGADGYAPDAIEAPKMAAKTLNY